MDISDRLLHLSKTLQEGADALRDAAREVDATPEAEATPATLEFTWRERLWLAPAETRMGVKELAEALGRSKSWVYKRTQGGAGEEILPYRKLDGELQFVVGEIRTYLHAREEVGFRLPPESTKAEARIVGRIGGKVA